MKKKCVIQTISLFALLLIFNDYAPAQTSQDPPLTKEQIEAFRSAKIVRIIIKQSYGEAEGVSLPFEKIIRKVFEDYAQCEVVGVYATEYDLTVKINAKGRALSREYVGLKQLSLGRFSPGIWTCYTGADLSGSIELEIEGLPLYKETFSERIIPPMEIPEVTQLKPSEAPFRHLIYPYIYTLLKMAGEIYGVDFVIAAHKESMNMAKGLSSLYVSFRVPAIVALVNIGDRAVEPLTNALNDEDKSVRLFSVEVLGKIKDPRAVEPLISILNDKSVDIRMLAAEVLGEMGDPRAVEFLTSSLRDKNPEVRIKAVEAIAKINHPSASEFLTAILGDKNPEVRMKVVEAFGEMKDPRTVVPLIEALEDKSNKVRIAAAYALGQMKEPRAVETLIFWMKTISPGFREAIIAALGEYDDTRTIELLAAALDDKDRNRRTCAAGALGRIDDPRVVEPLVEALLNEKDKGILVYIVLEVFSRMQEPLAVERLIAELKVAEKKNIGNIVTALQTMTKQGFGKKAEEWEAWWEENKDSYSGVGEKDEKVGKIIK